MVLFFWLLGLIKFLFWGMIGLLAMCISLLERPRAKRSHQSWIKRGQRQKINADFLGSFYCAELEAVFGCLLIIRS